MLKSIYLISAITFCTACTSPQNQSSDTHQRPGTTPSETDSSFISVDTANVMRDSYLQSISTDSPAKLQSWTVNADALREYLSNANIKEVNISLAHTMKYINDGYYGTPSGLSPNALTFVLTGIAANGSTIYHNTSYVLNRAKPCPTICITSAAK